MPKKSKPTKLNPRSAGVADIEMRRRIRLRRRKIGRLLVAKTVFSLRLLRAYTAIKDKSVQRRFVILVEMIAASQR